MRRREMAGCGHLLPFAAAAGLALGLALFAHQLLLTLAAVVIGPLPAVQTALYLSRKDLSENAAQAVSEPAQEAQAEPAQEAPALPAGDIEAYLVPLEGDEARPEGAGAILEKNYPQGSGEKYIPCGSGSIKNNTNVSNTDVAAEITSPLPFAVEWNSPDPQILIMHTHATEDYRLSAGLWYRPGDGSRTTDRDLNMCAVGRVMADTLNAAGLNTLHDETPATPEATPTAARWCSNTYRSIPASRSCWMSTEMPSRLRTAPAWPRCAPSTGGRQRR